MNDLTKMIHIVKDWPADGVTRVIEGYAMRGVHMPATPVRVEQVLVETAKHTASRSMYIRGRWTRRDEVCFSSWGKVELRRTA